MANLLIIIAVKLWFVLMYGEVRSVRDERRQLLKLLAAAAFGLLLTGTSQPVFAPQLDLIFSQSMYLCLASIISIYLRNVQTESRTSAYLLLLAVCPFLVFSTIYLFDYCFALPIRKGVLVTELTRFYHHGALMVLAGSLLYDVWVLVKRRSNKIWTASWDGQLGLSLGALKVCFFCVMLVQGALTHQPFGWQSPVFPLGSLVLLGIVCFLSLPGFRFAKAHLRDYFTSKIPNESSKVDFFCRTRDWQRIDELIDRRKLFLQKNLGITDLAVYTRCSPRHIKRIAADNLVGDWESYLDRKRFAYVLERLDENASDPMHLQRLVRLAGFASNRRFKRILERELERVAVATSDPGAALWVTG